MSSRYFWIARASPLVIPSPLLAQSAFAFPRAVSLYFEGLESDCMMNTASEMSTFSSQLASPNFVTSVEGEFEGEVVVDVDPCCSGAGVVVVVTT